MDGRIKIRIGQVEIECEGSEKFLEKELPKLLTEISKFYEKTHADLKFANFQQAVNGSTQTGANIKNIDDFDIAINSVAKKLDVKTASDLTIAAMARLSFGEKMDVQTEADIKAEIKLATHFNSANAVKNFKQSMKSLVGDKVHDKGSNKYSLSLATREELESKILGD